MNEPMPRLDGPARRFAGADGLPALPRPATEPNPARLAPARG